VGSIESEGFDWKKEKVKGPTYFNMDGIFCPEKCETESFTIEVNRRPDLMPESPFVYRINCNNCGSVVVKLKKR